MGDTAEEISSSWLCTTALSACHQALAEDHPYACFFREDTKKIFQIISNFLNEWRDAEWSLHEEIDLLNDDIEGLSERNAQLHSENTLLRSEVAELQAHANLLREANMVTEQKKCELDKDLVACRAETNCLRRRVETLAEEKESIASNNATLVNSLAALRAEKTEVEKECAKLRAQAEARQAKEHQPVSVVTSPHLRRGRNRPPGRPCPSPVAPPASPAISHHGLRTKRRQPPPAPPSSRKVSGIMNITGVEGTTTQGKAKVKAPNSFTRSSKGPLPKSGSTRITSRSLTRLSSPPPAAPPRSRSSRKVDELGNNGESPTTIVSRTPIRDRLRPRQRKEK